MNRQIKIFPAILFFIVLAISSATMAQETAKQDTSKSEMKKMNCSKDNQNSEATMNCKKGAGQATTTEIDVDGIDKNKDDKVFQCQMNYEVILDNPGVDPKCGMKLEEVSLEKAKENLISHGYKVKSQQKQNTITN